MQVTRSLRAGRGAGLGAFLAHLRFLDRLYKLLTSFKVACNQCAYTAKDGDELSAKNWMGFPTVLMRSLRDHAAASSRPIRTRWCSVRRHHSNKTVVVPLHFWCVLIYFSSSVFVERSALQTRRKSTKVPEHWLNSRMNRMGTKKTYVCSPVPVRVTILWNFYFREKY